MAKLSGEWEIFTVKYRLPVFGSEGEYQKETHIMIVQTKGGAEDAKKAAMQYHKGCKIDAVLDRLAAAADEATGGRLLETPTPVEMTKSKRKKK